MAANPSDIAKYTSDGVLITLKDEAIKQRDPNALDTGERELGMFFDDPAHGQIVAAELFAYVSAEGRPNEGIEIPDNLGLGTSVPVFPRAPRAHLIDDSRGINVIAAIRAYSFDMAEDAYAMEFVGLPPGGGASGGPTFDSDGIRFDNSVNTWDMGNAF